MRSPRALFGFGCAVALAVAPSAHAFNLTFENGDELATQLRRLAVPNTVTQTSNGGGANDFLNLTYEANTSATWVYDVNPSGNSVFNLAIGESLTLTADVLLVANVASIGLVFVNPSGENTASSPLALFNVNNTGTSDLFRFSATSNHTTTNGGTLTSTGNLLVETGAAPGTYFNISSTYTILSATSFSLSTTVGGQTSSFTYNSTPLFQVEAGVRYFNNTSGSTGQLDNFTSDREPVPEPSTAGLLALSSLGLLAARRRRE